MDDRKEYVIELFSRASTDADISVIEGVMGLFDGADFDSLDGSTAEVAIWLNATVLLVVKCPRFSSKHRAYCQRLYRFRAIPWRSQESSRTNVVPPDMGHGSARR